jgi:hypothetical protein
MKATLTTALAAALLLSGCATMIRGTKQEVSINSDPPGAEVAISNGQSCVTPCTIEAKRKQSLQVTFRKQGCRTATRSMVPTLSGGGAIMGGFVDYGTGAVYNLEPNPLLVTLTCDDS